MKPLILTFDIGTQSARGMLINKNGDIEAIEQLTYEIPYYSKAKNWAEQKPDFYYETICDIAKKLKAKNEKLFSRIIALTTTCFRDSTICLDEDMVPLRDMILWLDKREIDSDELPIPAHMRFVFKMAGIWDMCDMQHRQSVCNYIASRESEIWNKTEKYVVLSTYLNYKMTGNLIDSTANQIAHMPFDYKKRKWQTKKDLAYCVYPIPREKLCDLCEPGEKIGEVTAKFAEDSGIPADIPVIVTGSDKGCETIGLSVTSQNKAAISFGTSATIQFSTPNYFEPNPYCPCYPSPVRNLYNPENQIYRGFWMLTWFKNNFVKESETEEAKKMGISIEEYFNRHLKDVPEGCDGLMLQPYWSAGVANPNAKGVILGFSDVQTKYHIYRAIIEGINYELMAGLENMSRRGKQQIKEIYVGGGGSRSDEICQICSNMLGLPVKRIQTHEACGLGAAIIGFVSMGEYDDINEAINRMTHVSSVFLPDITEHRFYQKMYNRVYKGLGAKLEKIYVEIKHILKGGH